MFELLKEAETVPLFAKSQNQFWQEPYISEQLLKIHLSQEEEQASRKWSFIEKSLTFITTHLVEPRARIIDFGCGPGLYCQRLGIDHYVTGVDFSRNSIDYAKKVAEELRLPIHYYCQNYLEWQGNQSYDLALVIYCDYGALDQVERQQLLRNIYDSLKIGGKLFLDVFSITKFHATTEKRDWYHVASPGFWRPEEHSVVSQVKKYVGNVILDQSIVLTTQTAVTYNIWYQYFNRQKLMSELNAAGFEVAQWFADVAGRPYDSDSQTIAVVAEKR